MKIKRVIASLAAVSTALTMPSVTASAETVNTDDLQEISITLSVEEFADLASDYGYFVSIGGSSDIAEPQKHEDLFHTFTSNGWEQAGQDSTVLPETVQLQGIVFSGNIEYIEIQFQIHTTFKEIEEIRAQNSNTQIYNILVGTIYKIWMRAHPANGKAFSEDNKGYMSCYWTDRSWEVE